MANHLDLNEDGKADGEAANLDKKAAAKPGGLYVETDYKPKLKSNIQTATISSGNEPRSGMNRGVLSPSLGTPGGALNAGRSSGLPSSNRNRAVSELTDESEYDSEDDEESSEGEDSD